MPQKKSTYWVLIFIVYFCVHALIRTSMGWKLTVDELEMLRNTSSFAWLYGGELPLYVWLQTAVFDTFGVSIISLAILKNAILLGICLSVFTLVERVSNSTWAFVATISMLFVPQLVWTSQHTLTSPVLATLFAATTLASFCRLMHTRTIVNYLVLGAMIGLGALSTLSYLIVPTALLLAAISHRKLLPIILNLRFPLALAIAAAIAGRSYMELATTGAFEILSKIDIYPFSADIFLDRASSMYETLQTALAFTGLLIVGIAATVYGGLGKDREVSEPILILRELLLKTLVFGLFLVFAYTFLTDSHGIDQATLQPFLFFAAPVAALYMFPLMNQKTASNTFTIASAIAVIILLVTPAHYSFSNYVVVVDDLAPISNIAATAASLE